MTRFLDVPSMTRLVREVGVPRFITELAQSITADYLRWNEFDKSARLACHSPVGVIELMPVADAQRFAFKYVNGHPRNTGRGLFTVMAFDFNFEPMAFTTADAVPTIELACGSVRCMLAGIHLARR